jgi:hypothetical protein
MAWEDRGFFWSLERRNQKYVCLNAYSNFDFKGKKIIIFFPVVKFCNCVFTNIVLDPGADSDSPKSQDPES